MMNAKDYLQQVQKIDMIIKNKIIEKEQWMSMATSTTASSDGERVQSSGSQQKMADAVVRYVELEADIDRHINSLIDTKKDVIEVIEQLPAIEYDILHRVYIQYKDLNDVAAEYGKTYSWITTVHGRALQHVQDVLDKRG
jgi:DNA-directed RNA polymerase specialized sigma subunit